MSPGGQAIEVRPELLLERRSENLREARFLQAAEHLIVNLEFAVLPLILQGLLRQSPAFAALGIINRHSPIPNPRQHEEMGGAEEAGFDWRGRSGRAREGSFSSLS